LDEKKNIVKIVGADVDKEMISTAKKLEQCEYVLLDVSKETTDRIFSCVMGVFIVEHFKTVQVLESFIENCKKQL
jgi:hypothetical protein